MSVFPDPADPADPERRQEIESLAQTVTIDEVLVSVRCFRVTQPKLHFEIVLNGRREVAIVDVASSEESLLLERIEQSVKSFAAAIRVREQVERA